MYRVFKNHGSNLHAATGVMKTLSMAFLQGSRMALVVVAARVCWLSGHANS